MADALRVAIEQNDTAQVRSILAANSALANEIVADPLRAIPFAMKRGCDSTLVGLLLDASKGDINALYTILRTPSGKTLDLPLLAVAIDARREDYVRLLLDRGADPLVKVKDASLLQRLLTAGSVPIVALMLEKGPALRDELMANKALLSMTKSSFYLQLVLGLSDSQAKYDRAVADVGLPMMDVRMYTHLKPNGTAHSVVPIHTTKLPKGTLLFRGISALNSLPHDFLGVPTGKAGAKVYCLPAEYMVYFYPFPFIDTIIGNFSTYVIYVLTEDTEIGAFISPGPLARANRVNKVVPIQSCSEGPMGCGLEGRPYDPCLKRGFMLDYPHIPGIIGIAGQDRASFFRRLTSPKVQLGTYLNTYYGLYKDTLDDTPAIPEIILYPRKHKGFEDLTGTPVFGSAADFLRWLPDHEDQYVYRPYHVFGVRKTEDIKAFLDERFADGRIQLDATTGFFVDKAMAKPEYRGNLVPAGPDAIGTLDPTRLRFTRAAFAPPSAAAPATGTNAAGGP